MRRGALAALRPAGRSVTPHDRSGDLPGLALAPVPATPADALDLAVAWADDHTDQGAAHGLVKVAFRAILRAIPAVQRADVVNRLAGSDVLGDYLAATSSPPAGDPPF